jgi:hypothetical protein
VDTLHLYTLQTIIDTITSQAGKLVRITALLNAEASNNAACNAGFSFCVPVRVPRSL